MSICWWCYWGWPKEIADIFDEACRRLGDPDGWALEFGPGHVVWGDENWGSAEWCLEHFSEYVGDLTEEEQLVVRWSLTELAKIPLERREQTLRPDYDGEHPEKYPPPPGIVLVKR